MLLVLAEDKRYLVSTSCDEARWFSRFADRLFPPVTFVTVRLKSYPCDACLIGLERDLTEMLGGFPSVRHIAVKEIDDVLFIDLEVYDHRRTGLAHYATEIHNTIFVGYENCRLGHHFRPEAI